MNAEQRRNLGTRRWLRTVLGIGLAGLCAGCYAETIVADDPNVFFPEVRISTELDSKSEEADDSSESRTVETPSSPPFPPFSRVTFESSQADGSDTSSAPFGKERVEFSLRLSRLYSEFASPIATPNREGYGLFGVFLADVNAERVDDAGGVILDVDTSDFKGFGALVGWGYRHRLVDELWFDGRGTFGAGNAELTELQAGLHYTLFGVLRLHGGYRYWGLKSVEGDHPVDLEWRGPYAGVELRF